MKFQSDIRLAMRLSASSRLEKSALSASNKSGRHWEGKAGFGAAMQPKKYP